MIKRLDDYNFQQARYHSSRRDTTVDVVVLHYTAGRSNEHDLANFFANGSREASAHFGVGRSGGVIQMVELDRSAYHAGKSKFRGKGAVGWRSVGIEICNTGWAYMNKTDADHIFHGRHRNPKSNSKEWEKYTWAQVEAVNKLLVDLKAAIPTLKYVTGHEDIRNEWVVDVAGSKTDPGPAWPWHVLDLDGVDMEQWHFSYRDEKWYSVPDGHAPTH